jgi:hypothetical protein
MNRRVGRRSCDAAAGRFFRQPLVARTHLMTPRSDWSPAKRLASGPARTHGAHPLGATRPSLEWKSVPRSGLHRTLRASTTTELIDDEIETA